MWMAVDFQLTPLHAWALAAKQHGLRLELGLGLVLPHASSLAVDGVRLTTAIAHPAEPPASPDGPPLEAERRARPDCTVRGRHCLAHVTAAVDVVCARAVAVDASGLDALRRPLVVATEQPKGTFLSSPPSLLHPVHASSAHL
jgi:hypothetical protein